MRSPTELQRAHDLLIGLLLDTDFPRVADEAEVAMIMSQANVLCWALGHRHNTKFAQILLDIERNMADQGVVVVDRGAASVKPVKEK